MGSYGGNGGGSSSGFNWGTGMVGLGSIMQGYGAIKQGEAMSDENKTNRDLYLLKKGEYDRMVTKQDNTETNMNNAVFDYDILPKKKKKEENKENKENKEEKEEE
jgi:hypothetical protein